MNIDLFKFMIIWFPEKTKGGQTCTFYPISRFGCHSNQQRIEVAYQFSYSTSLENKGALSQDTEARYYSKVPKFSDARKHCWNLPKIQTKKPNLRKFHQKGANG